MDSKNSMPMTMLKGMLLLRIYKVLAETEYVFESHDKQRTTVISWQSAWWYISPISSVTTSTSYNIVIFLHNMDNVYPYLISMCKKWSLSGNLNLQVLHMLRYHWNVLVDAM